MGNLPAAYQSPRIEYGVLKWYEGDTFEMNIEVELMDQDGVRVDVQPTDTIEVVFYDQRHNVVRSFTFTEVENNIITIAVDDTVTALFGAGKYTYDIDLIGDRRLTLADGNQVIVE